MPHPRLAIAKTPPSELIRQYSYILQCKIHRVTDFTAPTAGIICLSCPPAQLRSRVVRYTLLLRSRTGHCPNAQPWPSLIAPECTILYMASREIIHLPGTSPRTTPRPPCAPPPPMPIRNAFLFRLFFQKLFWNAPSKVDIDFVTFYHFLRF